MYGFKMAVNKQLEISWNRLSCQKWENHFSEGILLINKEYKYNYTAEKKQKKVTWFRFKGQNKFWISPPISYLLLVNT